MRKKQRFHQAQSSSKKRKSRLKRKIYGGLFFCLLAGLIYFFIFWPGFLIEKVVIQPSPIRNTISNGVLREEVENMVQKILSEKFLGIIPQRSVILVPIHKIKANILETFPEVASVALDKNLNFYLEFIKEKDKILEIQIKEREPIGVWCKMNQCFYIDQEGIIYKESPKMNGSLILTIEDLRGGSVQPKTKVVDPALINFILIIKKELAEILDLKAVKFIISSIKDLRVMIPEGWQIYFNPEQTAHSQIEILKRVLEEEIKEARSSLEYLDLRVENRVYYK